MCPFFWTWYTYGNQQNANEQQLHEILCGM